MKKISLSLSEGYHNETEIKDHDGIYRSYVAHRMYFEPKVEFANNENGFDKKNDIWIRELAYVNILNEPLNNSHRSAVEALADINKDKIIDDISKSENGSVTYVITKKEIVTITKHYVIQIFKERENYKIINTETEEYVILPKTFPDRYKEHGDEFRFNLVTDESFVETTVTMDTWDYFKEEELKNQ